MTDKEYSSGQCRDYRICGRDVEGNPAEGWCILHSTDPAKDIRAFAEALISIVSNMGIISTGLSSQEATNFVWKPGSARAPTSSGATFTGDVSFYEATFNKDDLDFLRGPSLTSDANFGDATVLRRLAPASPGPRSARAPTSAGPCSVGPQLRGGHVQRGRQLRGGHVQ